MSLSNPERRPRLKVWKAAKRYFEKYPLWEDVPPEVQAVIIMQTIIGFLIGGGVMLAIFLIL